MKTNIILVSEDFGRYLDENSHNITEAIAKSTWTEFGTEIYVIMNNMEFSESVRVVAYLLSTGNWTVKRPRYIMQVLNDNDLTVNLDRETGEVTLESAEQMVNGNGTIAFQTLFTEEEIDNNPTLAKFKEWMKEYKED